MRITLIIWCLIVSMFAGCKPHQSAITPARLSDLEAPDTEYTVIFFNANKEKLSGNFESAIAGFMRCIELNPNESAAYYEAARIYDQENKLEEALPLISQAKKLAPENNWYQALYAQVNARSGRFDEAIKTYQQIIKQSPNEFDYYFQLASTYIFKNDYDAAIKVFNDIEEKVGVNEEISLQKQMLYMEMGKTKEAISTEWSEQTNLV